MLVLVAGLVFILWGAPRCCGGFTFVGDIRHYAVATNTVYIATEDSLFQLSHDLRLIQTLTQRGTLEKAERVGDELFRRVSVAAGANATFTVNVLVPYVENNTLVTCGVTDNTHGYCEVLDLRDISKVIHREAFLLGPPRRKSASVAFLVNVKKDKNETYILSAVEQRNQSSTTSCTSGTGAVILHNTNDDQHGLIFSPNDEFSRAVIKTNNVEFVDGFQRGWIIYLFSNVPSGDKNNKVRLIWLKGEGEKTEIFKSLRGATLTSAADQGSRLVASSVVPGGPRTLWTGVFSGGRGGTQLVLFDISPDLKETTFEDPDFCFVQGNKANPKLLRPVRVLFRQKHMTSVLAVRQKAWMVFFIGTEDGQLIKLAVDKRYHAACPKVLYRANDDRPVFPKIYLDQVDHKHLYMAFQNQVKRVPVSTCSSYTTLQDCWSAQDPYCVWCSSKNSCTYEEACGGSAWLSIPEESQHKMVSYEVVKTTDEITITVLAQVTVNQRAASDFTCRFSTNSVQLSCRTRPTFPQCTCTLPRGELPAEGLPVVVEITLGTTRLEEHINIFNCTNIRDPPASVACRQCLQIGCSWSPNGCTWANAGERNENVCQKVESGLNSTGPEIFSVSPNVVSFYGKNHAELSGRNLAGVTRVRIQANMDCKWQESPVWSNTGTSLTFRIPSAASKGAVQVCVVLSDNSCHGDATITYQSLPSCSGITPKSSWVSGNRVITLTGSHLEFVDGVMHRGVPLDVHPQINSSLQILTYHTPESFGAPSRDVLLRVVNETLPCSNITYHPDPEFTSFTTVNIQGGVRVTMQKKADKLEIQPEELSVWGIYEGKEHPCEMETTESTNHFFICEIQTPQTIAFKELKIKFGQKTVTLKSASWALILLVLLLIPFIVVLVAIVYCNKQKKLTAQMNKRMEELELDVRNDIRQGFVDLQTEKADLMENVGTIPFLDYKHFASRIFFPENDLLMKACIKDIGQDARQNQLDKCCQGLSKLLQDQLFLTSMVHALEEQRSFTIKDKCALASLLTVALHNKLSYLTDVMEALLKDLMQQNRGAQPKLLLRRTEFIVEKLLTNWMAICLYGFLRESVGQQLFLMVSALTQQIAKGPVDCVTEKALYTLSEDWLLWQAQDFSSLKLKVLFAVGNDGEVSEPLEVKALSCDTVEQVKEKILSTFKAKFGFSYSTTFRDLCLEYEKNGSFVPLQEVDASSEVIGDVTMLNTLKHYKVPDGATVKVLSGKTHPLSPQRSVRDDENFSGKYFHLIDPDVDEDKRKNPERKKLKLKEVHLTKLLSTKVALHSFVENLFRSIWGMPYTKAPHAVKYFFDFLDRQADAMRITEPDVLHIWKTNSLPLRFWVNIIKNPQFMFDMEKTPNLDGCLSVIAQAFMDSFSLSETQLGKHAPTNKLLYARDIPIFKQEVKAYYKQVREQPPVTASEFKDFLQQESKKHENEFDDSVALRELYKFIRQYFTEIKEKLDKNGAPSELVEQLHHVRNSFDGLQSCSWN
ncbi:plexin-C1 isoform X1 [Takifugu flavidus]|uniref:plexin-C1 isoform X1 n=1 Tax=Takifugu flavidus TaxID=433684 RepID=UPI0025449796|nr:plexin-C1 isoform X1 [Takifugu flavidus]